eukprot:gene11710-12931_t
MDCKNASLLSWWISALFSDTLRKRLRRPTSSLQLSYDTEIAFQKHQLLETPQPYPGGREEKLLKVREIREDEVQTERRSTNHAFVPTFRRSKDAI